MKVKFLILALFLSAGNLLAQTPEAKYGKTTGQLPYLNFGPGTDRLGGAKMSYIDSGLVIRIVDSTKEDYIVQLSKNQQAFVPRSNFKPVANVSRPDYVLTASWSVYGDEKYDYVNIGLQEKLPYRSIQQINPSRIVVDIFGATSNTNWITQLRSVKEIKNVYHEQLENDIFRVTIELKHAQHWGYFISYRNKSLVVKIKRQPEKLNAKNMLVAIDAGHGGSNSGASGTQSGILEKDYTLKMAKALEAYLNRKGVKTYMTRSEDIDVGMIDRTLMLRKADPDLMISLHLNSSSNANAKGVSTYYRYVGFRPLTQAVLNRMLELELHEFGNVGSFNFALSGPTEYPNCLLEVAFLTHPDDEKRIQDPAFHQDLAKKVYKGIKDWLKEVKKS
ncbi:MAG TPA: N-acetylmuramoyl-L-alanine amidase [Daejeonella sp.]|nr:N-acetylmuramoyl-L-alanine amidase [Daejeonella sp.]